MIRKCREGEVFEILTIINDGARAYRGVIPADRWNEPYMTPDELRREMDAGVEFWCLDRDGRVDGVMGIQAVQDVTLIRHAYVRTSAQRGGIGAALLNELCAMARTPVLIGTWASATWAIRFYEKHGFRAVDPAEKDRLLRQYWNVPERQVETSVVLTSGGV